MFLTVFTAQDNPACQGRLCLFLYSDCSIAASNPACKTFPSMNHLWLWGIHFV